MSFYLFNDSFQTCFVLQAKERESHSDLTMDPRGLVAKKKYPHAAAAAELDFFLQIFSQICPVFHQGLTFELENLKLLKITIFTACKLCKLFKYYVNSMVMSCSTCQKEEKECTRVRYVTYTVLPEVCQKSRNFSIKP